MARGAFFFGTWPSDQFEFETPALVCVEDIDLQRNDVLVGLNEFDQESILPNFFA